MRESIKLDNDKYEIILVNNGKEFKAERYGKEWRNLIGDNLILSMFFEIQELKEKLSEFEKPNEIKNKNYDINNRIRLKVGKDNTRLSSFESGRLMFDEQIKDKIDYNVKNIMVFPQHVEDISISFVKGVMEEVWENIGLERLGKTIGAEGNEKIANNL